MNWDYVTKRLLFGMKKMFLIFVKKSDQRAKPIVIAANKADLPPTEDNIEKIRNLGRDVVPCVAEAEALLRRAAKKGILHYLPGDNSFDIKSGILLNEQQKKNS